MVAATTAAVLVVGGIGYAATRDEPGVAPPPAASTPGKESPDPSPSTSKPVKAKPVDPLTGGRVNDRPVIAVKVENIAAARPQIGLNKADIVFIEEVEGRRPGWSRSTTRRSRPARSGSQRPQHRRTTLAALRQTRTGLLGGEPPGPAPHRQAAIVPRPLDRDNRGWRRTTCSWTWPRSPTCERSAKPGLSAGPSPGTPALDDGQDGRVTRVGGDMFPFDYDDRYTVRWSGETYADGGSGKPRPTMSWSCR